MLAARSQSEIRSFGKFFPRPAARHGLPPAPHQVFVSVERPFQTQPSRFATIHPDREIHTVSCRAGPFPVSSGNDKVSRRRNCRRILQYAAWCCARKSSNEKRFFHSVQLTCSHAVRPLAVRKSKKALSSTGMFQKKVAALTVDLCEPAQKPTGQINQMNPLINQFTAAGKFRVGAPFLIVAHASTVAIARTNEHQIAHHAGSQKSPAP